SLVVQGDPRPRYPHLHASPLPAVALRPRIFLGLRPCQRNMAPLASDAVRPLMNASRNGNAAPAPGPKNHSKHHMLTRCRAIGSLGNSKAVCIVGDAHLAA